MADCGFDYVHSEDYAEVSTSDHGCSEGYVWESMNGNGTENGSQRTLTLSLEHKMFHPIKKMCTVNETINGIMCSNCTESAQITSMHYHKFHTHVLHAYCRREIFWVTHFRSF